MRRVVRSPSQIDRTVVVSGDKSISQRALILNSIATGTAHVSNVCEGDDRSSILRCLRGLGVRIRRHSACAVSGSAECFEVQGVGLGGLEEPAKVLNAGNSATAFRLVSGLAAGQPFLSVMSGDRSLRRRPMTRIVRPLTEMGAKILGRNEDSLAPMAIKGGDLRGIDYDMPVASAQVKSSILIAGLFADGRTTVRQPAESRDHTERMLRWMGADLETDGLRVSVRRSELQARHVPVPGDISSAAFWIVAGCCHPNARIRIEGVGINETRSGVIRVLQAMGARITLENVREDEWEPTTDIVAETSELEATEIRGATVPHVIDELPVLALAACMAKGTTVIEDAGELRAKESDRIQATVAGLSKLGANIEERPDGIVINGTGSLAGGECQSYGDHRIAMTMAIAGLAARGETVVDGAEAAGISYPGFWDTMSSITEAG